MRWKGILAGVTTIVVIAVGAAGQYAEQPPERATAIPTEGFWPTQKMMDRIIDRIVDQMSKHYDLDENQNELTRDLLGARYPEFLKENRAEIQTLLNQYFEALLNDEPPAPEEVAEWAAHVQPLLAKFGEVTHEVTESMREYMSDDQTVMLDAETAAFDAGLTMARNKLSVWANGGYDPETEWIHPPPNQDDPDDRDVAPDNEEEQPAEDTDAGPLDEWGVYTLRFVERYQLTDEQRQKAFTILRRQQEARDRYLRRKVDEMSRVTKVLSEAETEEERQAALAAYERLNAPVDRIFQQLKERLDTLPTRAQRRDAAERGPSDTQPAASEPVATEDARRLEELGYIQPAASRPSEPPTPEP